MLVNAAVCQLAALCPIDLPLLTACCHLTLAHTHTEIRGSASKRSTAWVQSHRPVPGIDYTGCFRKHEYKAGKARAVPTRLWGTHADPVYTWYLDTLLVIWSVWSAVTHGRKNASHDLREANFTFIDLVYQFVANENVWFSVMYSTLLL